MKKNTLIRLITLFIIILAFAACSKTPAAPEIILTEVGHGNGKTAEQGDDLHLEADIVAEGLIKGIFVEIHQENGSFKLEESYTAGKYIGVKNTEFHEHIDIPANAPLGEYHLHFTVTDQQGQRTQAEAHIEVIENDGHDDDDED